MKLDRSDDHTMGVILINPSSIQCNGTWKSPVNYRVC